MKDQVDALGDVHSDEDGVAGERSPHRGEKEFAVYHRRRFSKVLRTPPMNLLRTRRIPWHGLVLFILLCYPVMASRYLPFGGGARYLSVIAAPSCLLLLLSRPRTEWLVHLKAAFSWSLPFLPMVLGWWAVRAWHGYDPVDYTPVSRVLLAALLFIGARIVGIKYWQLAYAAAFGALVCGLIAGIEVFALGRERAWGGVYENRFAQYAVWMALLCLLHAMQFRKEGGNTVRMWLLLGAVPPALMAILLTGSRGALIALPIAVLIVFARSFEWRRALVLALAVAAMCAIVVIAYEPFRMRIVMAYMEFMQYFSESAFNGTSVGIRLELARVALLTLSAHPWLGVGYTSLPALYSDYAGLLGAMPQSITPIPSFHSDWFHAIGIGGVTLVATLLASVVWMFVTARRDIFRTSFVICALVFSISELFFWHKMGLSLLITTWALYAAAAEDKS